MVLFLSYFFKLFSNANGGIRGTGADDKQSNGQQKEEKATFGSLQLAGDVDQVLFHC
jgi:hypothetical protein